MELLKKLTEATGVPGYEGPIRRVILDALAGHVDSVDVDLLGNVIAHKAGKGPVVALAGHMDEIGFLVSHIEEKTGFLRIQPLGGFDPVTLVAQRVVVHAQGGDLVGCIGRQPIHILTDDEKKKPVEINDLFIDVGLPGAEVAEQVAVGDVVTMKQDFVAYGDVVSGKAIDDRVGVYVALEAMKRAKKLSCDLYFVASTQEEVGVRGATVAGYRLHPQISIALDVCIAADMPGVPERDQVSQMRKGVAISLKDARSISHPGLVRAFRDLAEKRKIPYQMTLSARGGTDAGAMQLARDGSAAITLSIPTRYVHSVVETVHVADIEATIALLAAFLETANKVDLSG
ncbi:MAG: M42 family metallopeptidase [Candidatus Bipolaricaulota bacterium]|nr:M42 family metallopeptidase [Candidatus Bipolaricaulota bacterium]